MWYRTTMLIILIRENVIFQRGLYIIGSSHLCHHNDDLNLIQWINKMFFLIAAIPIEPNRKTVYYKSNLFFK